MTEKNKISLDSISKLDGVIGIAVIDKFKNIKYNSLPEWINLEIFIKNLDNLLEGINNITRNLRQGDHNKTMIEIAKANLMISLIRNDILIVLTNKDKKIKLFDKFAETKILEFKN
ncbi:MAG: roadblock/LC7 domain-containing protein [Promethearchaeota archaeon]